MERHGAHRPVEEVVGSLQLIGLGCIGPCTHQPAHNVIVGIDRRNPVVFDMSQEGRSVECDELGPRPLEGDPPPIKRASSSSLEVQTLRDASHLADRRADGSLVREVGGPVSAPLLRADEEHARRARAADQQHGEGGEKRRPLPHDAADATISGS